jgi:anti-anti-sigma regulatory factor
MATSVLAKEGTVVIEVEGNLDTVAAAQLLTACQLADADHDARTIVVDFSRAKSVSVVALAAFVGNQRQVRASIRLDGLSNHHRRILDYLRGKTSRPERTLDGIRTAPADDSADVKELDSVRA